MDKVTFYDIITSPFVTFVLIPIILALMFFAFHKEPPKGKRK